MVRAGLVRRFLACLCVCLCIGTGTAAAATYSVYSQGNISTSILTYFRDIESGIGIDDNYVFWRSGQYEYKMAVGSLKCDSTSFASTGDYLQVYTLNTNTSSYDAYRLTVSTEQDFHLSASNYLVYSDLGHYPKLHERGVNYAFCTLFVVCIIGLCALVRPLFSFVLRIRNG